MRTQNIYVETELLNGNVNRMCVTDNMNELEEMRMVAKHRIDKIYHMNKSRLEDQANDSV